MYITFNNINNTPQGRIQKFYVLGQKKLLTCLNRAPTMVGGEKKIWILDRLKKLFQAFPKLILTKNCSLTQCFSTTTVPKIQKSVNYREIGTTISGSDSR